MKTIKRNLKSEIEINKSRFICIMYKIKAIDEVQEKLLEVKKMYKDATHYCYAYIIDDARKSSDDNEPGGTAGVPIMEVLLKNDLNYVLCIVVRYFGGIKLGAGGLVRAYSKSVRFTLGKNNIVELFPGYKVTFVIDYPSEKKIDYLLKDYKTSKVYTDNISYTVDIPKDKIDILKNINYQINDEMYIEKVSD